MSKPRELAGLLVERLTSASDLGDRREALDDLLRLSESHPAEVGQAGLSTFTDILQAGVADESMAQVIIEIMLNLVTAKDDLQRPGVAANVAGILTDVANVQNLLDLLESSDVLTALTAIRVLQHVQRDAAASLEAAILECPAGMQRLMDVLKDSREEVRNEGLLLLGQLTHNSAEVAKFVAFQEGFERLVRIMSEEGMGEGGVVVRDCLDVAYQVLKAGGAVAMTLFCQGSALSVFHELVDVRAFGPPDSNNNDQSYHAGERGSRDGSAAVHRLSREHSAAVSPSGSSTTDRPRFDSHGNFVGPSAAKGGDSDSGAWLEQGSVGRAIISRAFGILELLLAPSAAAGEDGGSATAQQQRAERQVAVGSGGEGALAELLVHVGFSQADPYCRVPPDLRKRAMGLLAALLDGNAANQSEAALCLVQGLGDSSLELPTLLVEGALAETEAGFGAGYHAALAALFSGNELGCTQVVTHIIAPPPPPLDLPDIDFETWVPPVPPGKILLDRMSAAAAILLGEEAPAPGAEAAADELCRGCKILALLLRHGCLASKEIALRIPMTGLRGLPTSLLPCTLSWLQAAAAAAAAGDSDAAGVCVALLQLLCQWLAGCRAATQELLSSPSNLFIVDLAAAKGAGAASAAALGPPGSHITGLCCLALGMLLENLDDAPDAAASAPPTESGMEWNRGVVTGMLASRVGMSALASSVDAVRRSMPKELADRQRRAGRASAGALPPAPAWEDQNFLPLLQSAAEQLRRRVFSMYTGGGGAGPERGGGGNGGDGSPESALLRMQEAEIVELKARLAAAEEQLAAAAAAASDVLPGDVGGVSGSTPTAPDLALATAFSAGDPNWHTERGGLAELGGAAAADILQQLADRDTMLAELRAELAAAGAAAASESAELAAHLADTEARASRFEAEAASLAAALRAEQEGRAEEARLRVAAAAAGVEGGESLRQQLEEELERRLREQGQAHDVELARQRAALEEAAIRHQQEVVRLHAVAEDAARRGQEEASQARAAAADAARRHESEGVALAADRDAVFRALEDARREVQSARLDAESASAAKRQAEEGKAAAEAALLAERSRGAEASSSVEAALASERDAALAELDQARREASAAREEAQAAHVYLSQSEEGRVNVEAALREARGVIAHLERELDGARRDAEDARQDAAAAVDEAAAAAAAAAKRLDAATLSGGKTVQLPLANGGNGAYSGSSGGSAASAAVPINQQNGSTDSLLQADYEDMLLMLAQLEFVKNALAARLRELAGAEELQATLLATRRDVAKRYGAYIDYDGDEETQILEAAGSGLERAN